MEAAGAEVELELRSYISVLWYRRWIVLVTLAVVLGIVALAAFTAEARYTATTTIRVVTRASLDSGAVRADDLAYVDRLENTYAHLLEGEPLRDQLQAELGLDKRPDVSAEPRANTELMDVVAEASSPELAVRIADSGSAALLRRVLDLNRQSAETADSLFSSRIVALEQELTDQKLELQQLEATADPADPALLQLGESIRLREASIIEQRSGFERNRLARDERASTLAIIEPARLPTGRSSPNVALYLAIGLIVGAIGAVGLAFLAENLRPRLQTRRDVEGAADLNVLAEIPWGGRGPQRLFNSGSTTEASFQVLRTVLFFGPTDGQLRSALITSTEAGEGKSTVVANLAQSIAKWGKPVLIVDGDLHRPSQHRIFGLDNEVGLSHVLAGAAVDGDAIQATPVPNVFVLPSGPPVPDPAGALGSQAMLELVEQLQDDYALVLIDSPSLLGAADALALVPLVGGVILVARRGRVAPEDLQGVRALLDQVHAHLLGVVLNGGSPPRDEYSRQHMRSRAHVEPTGGGADG